MIVLYNTEVCDLHPDSHLDFNIRTDVIECGTKQFRNTYYNCSERDVKLKLLFREIFDDCGFIMTREFYEWLKSKIIADTITSDDFCLMHDIYQHRMQNTLSNKFKGLNI